MNVLIYEGPPFSLKSTDNALHLLRSILLPNYTVQPLSGASHAKDPWEVGCKVIVYPCLAPNANDTGVKFMNTTRGQKLRKFVEEGGIVLGLGYGAKWEAPASDLPPMESAMLGLSLSPHGSSTSTSTPLPGPLKFFDKEVKLDIVPQTLANVELQLADGESKASVTEAKIHWPEGLSGSSGATEDALSVVRPLGKGFVSFIRPTLLDESPPESILKLLRSVLTDLGLKLPQKPTSAPKPLPQFFTSLPSASSDTPADPIVSTITKTVFPAASVSAGPIGTIKDTADTFVFLPLGTDQANEALQAAHDNSPGDIDKQDRVIIVCPDGTLPPQDQTPKFNLSLYFETLRKLRDADLKYVPKDPDQEKTPWNIGDALLYSERVTSTQSLFDRNPELLTRLPAPVLSLASQQISGRGRGSNVWLSPEGCLMFSLLLRIDLDTSAPRPAASSGLKSAKTTKTSPAQHKSNDAGILKTGAKTTSGGLKTTDSGLKTTGTGLKTTEAGLKTSDSGLKTTGTGLKTTEAGLKTTGTGLKTTGTGLKTTGTGLKTSETQSAQSADTPEASGPPPVPPLPRLSASRLVFIQYLFALAVAEAVRLPECVGSRVGSRVRLKWPNDIYINMADEGEEWKKIGGILVNTNFAPGGKVDIVIGCGLNVGNEEPITSLLQAKRRFEPHLPDEVSAERTAAAIMICFERMWARFVREEGSWASFDQTYLQFWLHSEQEVQLTTVDPPRRVKIIGITHDYGLLRTVADQSPFAAFADTFATLKAQHGFRFQGPPAQYGEWGGRREYIDLQPDGNSFDLMAGLIKAKTTIEER